MRATLVTYLAAIAACGDVSTSPDSQPALDAAMLGDAAVDGCGETPLPVFLNRAGGTYTSGPDDPATNTSAILTAAATLLPYGEDDATWQGIVSCVADLLVPFNLRVTTTDPGAVPQIEIVVTSSDSEFAVPGPGSVAQVSPFNCAVEINSVHFVMPNEVALDPGASTASPRVICSLAAQAIGHAAGLEYTPDCSDVMAYSIDRPSCTGTGGFSAADLPCGLIEVTQCRCPQPTNSQNSFAAMRAAFSTCP